MSMNKIAEFSDRLSEAIKDSGLTATELSQKIGLSKQAISMYTSGKRHPKQPTVESISRAFNLNPAWLLGYDVDKYVQQPKEKANASDISDEINNVLDKLVQQPEGLMFCGKPLDNETKHLLKLSLEHAMKLAIEMDKNKESE